MDFSRRRYEFEGVSKNFLVILEDFYNHFISKQF